MNRFPAIRSALFATVIGLAGTGCPCPDGEIERTETISDKEFTAELTACLADDLACEDLCRAVIIARGFEEGDAEAGFPAVSRCIVSTVSATSYQLDMTYFVPVDCVGGRRPANLGPARCAPDHPTVVGRWLADLAHLEAAAIYAFVEMARELNFHGAPARLVRRALESAADERRHAAVAARMSLANGVTPSVPRASLAPVRPLVEVAMSNAVEGCVRELYGAAVALWQASAASDPYRDAFRVIAADELRHAELSFEVHAWLCTRLDPEQRAEVCQARSKAAAELVAEVSSQDRALDAELISVLGLPGPAQARELAAQVALASINQRGARLG